MRVQISPTAFDFEVHEVEHPSVKRNDASSTLAEVVMYITKQLIRKVTQCHFAEINMFMLVTIIQDRYGLNYEQACSAILSLSD